jgi:hypothetical protein
MAVLDGSTERAPLLARSTSPSLSERDGKVKKEEAIPTSRGAFIVGSVGLLIFLQGMLDFDFVISTLYGKLRPAMSDFIASHAAMPTFYFRNSCPVSALYCIG